jgi:hypothetical protein
MQTLLTPTEVIVRTGMYQLDESLINTSDIVQAQATHLLPLFTTDNQTLLKSSVTSNFPLILDEILNCVAWWTLYEVIDRLYYHIVSSGIQINQITGGQPASEVGVTKIKSSIFRTALQMDDNMITAISTSYNQSDVRTTKIIAGKIITKRTTEMTAEDYNREVSDATD